MVVEGRFFAVTVACADCSRAGSITDQVFLLAATEFPVSMRPISG
jgi:hypothetical protein